VAGWVRERGRRVARLCRAAGPKIADIATESTQAVSKKPQRVKWGSAHGAALRGRILAAQCLQMHICLHKFAGAEVWEWEALVFSRAPSEGGGVNYIKQSNE